MQFGPRIGLHVIVRVPRNPANRELCVEIPDVRRTCQTLDEFSPQVFEWWWKDLIFGSGEGEVWAVLARGHPLYDQQRAREPFQVIAPE